MGWHWLSPKRLAGRLARGEISNTEVAYFLLATWLVWAFIYYVPFTAANAPWTWLSLWEAVLYVLVTVYGMTRCFEAAGGEGNPAFVSQFTCFSFPITVWVTLCTWPAYWVVLLLTNKTLIQFGQGDEPDTRWLAYLAGWLTWLWTVAAVVGAQAAFFYWMRKSLRRVQMGAAA